MRKPFGLISYSESMAASLYNQEEKNECRSRLIKHAVRCLTTERETSVCVTPYHVNNIWKNLLETQEAMQYFSIVERLNIANAIEEWESFHKSRVQTKTPQDLRVCYLAGDNPINDLQVLIDNGILTQNVWAVEKDRAILKDWFKINHPMLKSFKLFKGDLINFLTDLEEQFDIIYYDACASLPSDGQNTLKVIGTVFLHNKLTSPGALITNFSFTPKQAPEQDEENSSPQDEKKRRKEKQERERIMFLAKKYLEFRELNTPAFQDHSENYENIPATLNTRTVEDTYSDYITYQVIDSASVYIPALRLLYSNKGSLWDQLYTKKGDFLEKVKLYDTGEEYDSTSSDSYLRKIGSAMKTSENSLCKAWVTEIFPDWKTSLLKKRDISSLLLTHHLSCSEEFIGRFANKEFLESYTLQILPFYDLDDREFSFVNSNWTRQFDELMESATLPSFCDALDAASATCLVGGLLYGQLANPSFPVTDKLLQLRYTAKERQMFSHVFIFDTCRYLYDQFTSVDFASFFFKSVQQQMLLKMIVNGLRTHLKGICYKEFCNVADVHVNSWHTIPQWQNVLVNSPDPFPSKVKGNEAFSPDEL